MRIKKKNIREGFGDKESESKDPNKAADSGVKKVEVAIKNASDGLENLGIEVPDADKIAKEIVSSELENKLTEVVKPSMTKRELIESVSEFTKSNRISNRKVVKILKVKDLRNE